MSSQCIHMPLDKPVQIIIAQAAEAGHDREQISRDIAQAFRAAVSTVVAGAGRVEPEDSIAEMEAMEAGTINYPALGMAELMRVALQMTGRDLTSLMDQETLWRAVQELVAVHLPPA